MNQSTRTRLQGAVEKAVCNGKSYPSPHQPSPSTFISSPCQMSVSCRPTHTNRYEQGNFSFRHLLVVAFAIFCTCTCPIQTFSSGICSHTIQTIAQLKHLVQQLHAHPCAHAFGFCAHTALVILQFKVLVRSFGSLALK